MSVSREQPESFSEEISVERQKEILAALHCDHAQDLRESGATAAALRATKSRFNTPNAWARVLRQAYDSAQPHGLQLASLQIVVPAQESSIPNHEEYSSKIPVAYFDHQSWTPEGEIFSNDQTLCVLGLVSELNVARSGILPNLSYNLQSIHTFPQNI